MKWFIIFVILIAILLIIGGIYLYFHKEVKAQEDKITYGNLNILASTDKKQIVTGFIVSLNDIRSQYSNGTTLENNYLLSRVPMNNTIYIRNYNLENQSYYTFVKKVDTFDFKDLFRVLLVLNTPGELTITSSNLTDDCNFNLTVKASDVYRNPFFCIHWSTHIIKTDIEGFQSINNPKNYSSYDKCFSLDTLKTSEERVINVRCTYFGKLDKYDKISFIFSDQDIYEGITNDKWYNPTKYNVEYINNI